MNVNICTQKQSFQKKKKNEWKAFIQSAISESQGSVANNAEVPTLKFEVLHLSLGPALQQCPISTWGHIWHLLLASVQMMKQDLASSSKFSQFSYRNTTCSSGHWGQMVPGSRKIQIKPPHRSGVPWLMLEPIKFYHYCICLGNILHVWRADYSPGENFIRAVAATGAASTDSMSGWCFCTSPLWTSVPLGKWGEPPLPMEPEMNHLRPLYLRFLTAKHKWLRLKWFQIPWDKTL